MRAETVVSPVPPGAGRLMDFTWPDPLQSLNNAIQAGIRGRNDGGTTAAQLQCAVTAIGAGSSVIAATWNGIGCAQMLSVVGGAQSWKMDTAGACHPFTTKNAIPNSANDRAAYRYVAVMALGLAPNANTDVGFQLGRSKGTTGRILIDANDGIGFNYADLNTVNLIIRGNNGLITTPIAVAPFDVTAWHAFEFQIVSATATQDATLTVLIDGVAVTGLPAISTSWGPGTNLPPTALGGGITGFSALVTNSAGNANGLFIQSIRMMAAPSIAACL